MYINRTSNAYALDYETYEAQYIERKTNNRKNLIKKKKQQRRKRLAFFLANLTVMFVLMGTIVLRYTGINELTNENISLKKQYDAIVSENKSLQIQISTMQDSETIQEIATSKLNMSRPENYQIVYVNTPKTDKVVVVSKR